MNKLNVALDGPAGAGKSTVARLVAKALGYVHIDTGSMYRAVTWRMLKEGLKPEQSQEIAAMAARMRIALIPGDHGQEVWVDGENVTEAIRTIEVNRHVSSVAQIPEVRELLVEKQKELAKHKGVVMDGRDIGTHVLPDADVKVFLTASVQERAARRYKELLASGQDISIEQLEKDIEARDRMDTERATSPLVQAEDAILLDCTDLSLTEVVDEVLNLCRTASGRS